MWNVLKCNNCAHIWKSRSGYTENCSKCGMRDGVEQIYDPKFSENTKERYEWENSLTNLLKNKLPNNFLENRQPFFPSISLYKMHANKEDILISMADEIFEFLNIPRNDVIITFNSKLNNIPGLYTIIEGKEVILINSKYKNNPYIIGAILAHEITHLFLISRNNICIESEYENEIFTDLASIQLGLGVLIINGMEYKSNWFFTAFALLGGSLYINTKTLSFGYFQPKPYGERFLKYCVENNIAINNVASYIHPKAWHFIKLPIMARFKKTSIFYKQSLVKLLLNLFGVIIIIIFASTLFYFKIQSGLHGEPQNPTINQETLDLKYQMDTLEIEVGQQDSTLNTYRKLLDGYDRSGDYDSYNSLVDKYNVLLNKYKSNINDYNSIVKQYNASLK